jgi:hypothetical protein
MTTTGATPLSVRDRSGHVRVFVRVLDLDRWGDVTVNAKGD